MIFNFPGMVEDQMAVAGEGFGDVTGEGVGASEADVETS